MFGSKVEAGIERGLYGVQKKIGQLAKTKMVSKPILKKSKTSYKMPDRPISNIFEDDNKFFKGAVKNEFL